MDASAAWLPLVVKDKQKTKNKVEPTVLQGLSLGGNDKKLQYELADIKATRGRGN